MGNVKVKTEHYQGAIEDLETSLDAAGLYILRLVQERASELAHAEQEKQE